MFMLPTISLRIERWKFNKDYGVYVSTLGHFKDRHKRPLPIKINDRGYCLVKTEAPKQPWKLAHRIVMLTWKPIPDAENLTVDHLDHNKRDNSLTNLEWVTEQENHKRAAADYMPSAGVTKKKPNPRSPQTPLEDYQKAIVGFKVNGVVYPNAAAVRNAYMSWFSKYPAAADKLDAAIYDLTNRINLSGSKKVGSKKHYLLVSVVLEGD